MRLWIFKEFEMMTKETEQFLAMKALVYAIEGKNDRSEKIRQFLMKQQRRTLKVA